jgi:hypothetical protein
VHLSWSGTVTQANAATVPLVGTRLTGTGSRRRDRTRTAPLCGHRR